MTSNRSYYRPRTPDFPLAVSYFFNEGVIKTPLYLHSSVSIEFTFLQEGQADICVDGKTLVLHPGEIHIIIPGQNYTFRSVMPKTSYIHLSFSPDLISSSFGHFFQKRFVEPLKCGILQVPRVIRPEDAAYAKMVQEMRRLDAAKEGMEEYTCELFSVAFSLCAALLPFCTEKDRESGSQKSTENTENVVRICLEYMHTHYADNITLAQLAQLVHLHPNYLCALFKKFTGITIFEQLSRFRINRASRFLRSTNSPVNQIAEKCGFQSASFFCRKFVEYYGMSPTAYRKIFNQQLSTEHWEL